MKATLLVLAAGIGSRYGGIKQMDGIGPSGESIIDYSVFDAIRAGFEKIVFVVNKTIEEDFREVWQPKLNGKVECDFVVQDLNDLPTGFKPPADRTKPWGTGQAVLAARQVIDTPFAVINADDFYGREAYELIREFILDEECTNSACMVGYHLKNTLSAYGSVSRGICRFDNEHLLEEITEITNIEKRGDLIGYESSTKDFTLLDGQTVVSMNIWGFKPEIMRFMKSGFESFLIANSSDLKAEYYLPARINDLIRRGFMSVKLLETNFKWFGVTYRDDKAETIDKVSELIENGEYPSNLWNS